MFSLLKRKKKDTRQTYPVLQRLGAAINKRQRGLADYLTQKTAGFSKTKLLVLLILFSALWGGSSAYIIWKGLNRVTATPSVMTSIHAPRLIYEDSVFGPDRFDSAIVFRRIELFRIYVDSLRYREPRRYDSILRARPGLMDSLRAVERLYRQ
jgi:hypothetical protein